MAAPNAARPRPTRDHDGGLRASTTAESLASTWPIPRRCRRGVARARDRSSPHPRLGGARRRVRARRRARDGACIDGGDARERLGRHERLLRRLPRSCGRPAVTRAWSSASTEPSPIMRTRTRHVPRRPRGPDALTCGPPARDDGRAAAGVDRDGVPTATARSRRPHETVAVTPNPPSPEHTGITSGRPRASSNWSWVKTSSDSMKMGRDGPPSAPEPTSPPARSTGGRRYLPEWIEFHRWSASSDSSSTTMAARTTIAGCSRPTWRGHRGVHDWPRPFLVTTVARGRSSPPSSTAAARIAAMRAGSRSWTWTSSCSRRPARPLPEVLRDYEEFPAWSSTGPSSARRDRQAGGIGDRELPPAPALRPDDEASTRALSTRRG